MAKKVAAKKNQTGRTAKSSKTIAERENSPDKTRSIGRKKNNTLTGTDRENSPDKTREVSSKARKKGSVRSI